MKYQIIGWICLTVIDSFAATSTNITYDPTLGLVNYGTDEVILSDGTLMLDSEFNLRLPTLKTKFDL